MYIVKHYAEKIFYVEKCISNPDKYLMHLNEIDKNTNSYKNIGPWETWSASNDKNSIYGEKKKIYLNFKNNEDEKIDKKIRYLINSIKESFMLCSTMYLKHNNIKQAKINISQCYINKYFSGQSMGPHSDSSGNEYDKNFTILLYLNDDYEGGEIIFNDKNLNFKPKAGSMLIFPASEIHSSNMVKNGNKYFILGQF